MRHGQRLDDIEPDWRLTTDRPWDPPLSPEGLRQARSAYLDCWLPSHKPKFAAKGCDTGCLQARAAAGRLKQYNIDKLVTSPFVRCLQTAKELERELPGAPTAEIAYPFCEVTFLGSDDSCK